MVCDENRLYRQVWGGRLKTVFTVLATVRRTAECRNKTNRSSKYRLNSVEWTRDRRELLRLRRRGSASTNYGRDTRRKPCEFRPYRNSIIRQYTSENSTGRLLVFQIESSKPTIAAVETPWKLKDLTHVLKTQRRRSSTIARAFFIFNLIRSKVGKYADDIGERRVRETPPPKFTRILKTGFRRQRNVRVVPDCISYLVANPWNSYASLKNASNSRIFARSHILIFVVNVRNR